MNNQPKTRQELYDRIKASSKQEVILEEMSRLGFWSKDDSLPKDPEDETKRIAELENQLKVLRTEQYRLKNEDAMKREFRKRRMEESKKKKQETKERRIKEKLEKAEKWKQKQQKDIVYLGEKISGGLNNTISDENKLIQLGLPILHNASNIADSLKISINKLRFLAFSREVSTVNHYISFKIPKKTGGMRIISSPMPQLKQIQYWILDSILKKINVNGNAHGFISRRSIITNAEPHIGSKVVINIDLKDFFPSISYKRVKGLFKSFGYSEAVSTILGLLCTESRTEMVELEGKTYYVSQGDRFLPQGAPTSPAITNLICRRMDKRLLSIATKLNFRYTRYADDITFSTSINTSNIGKLLRQTEYIVKSETFTINKDKTRIIRRKNLQEVTGIVVNEKLNISRKKLKRFRALLHQIDKDGIQGKKWGASTNIIASIKGFANYVSMVNLKKGNEFKDKIKKIIEKYGLK